MQGQHQDNLFYLHCCPHTEGDPSLVTFWLSESRGSFRCWIAPFFLPWTMSDGTFFFFLNAFGHSNKLKKGRMPKSKHKCSENYVLLDTSA